MRVKKLLTAILFSVALLCMSCTVAWAEMQVDGRLDIHPMWVNANGFTPIVSFTGSTAECKATIEGFSGTTKITATITLSQKNSNGTYTEVAKWSNRSVSGQTLEFSDTCPVTKGYTYRLSVTADVTRNGSTETVSASAEKSYQ